MKKISFQTMLTLSFVFLVACSTFNKPSVSGTPAKTADEISFMSFNVENLFDTVRDGTHDDSTYLPLSAKRNTEHQQACAKISNPFYRGECQSLNWSEDVLQVKLQNIADVILGVDGNGPDMLVLLEVENLNIVTRLNNDFLAKAGYKTVALIPSADKRGITVGFLSRFPLVGKPQLHKIPFVGKDEKDKEYLNETRGILEVNVQLPNKDNLTVFGAHFPSQASPHEWRDQATRFLAELMRKKGPQAMVIGGGDLNITAEEDNTHSMFKTIFEKDQALVSHIVGCKECPGTHNYRKAWSFLDVQIYAKSFGPSGTASYELEPQTIDVIRYNSIHLSKGKYPKRFDPEQKTGVSDHFPLYARFKKRTPPVPASAAAAP